MNIKLHTPKSLKMGSGMNSLKQFLLSIVAILFTTCGMCVAQHIPQVPDYHDATMWITVEDDSTGTGADVFYVVSTWEED